MGRILVIDDDEQIRRAVRRGLESSGHEVLEADNGDSGLKLYKQGPVDLVIMDILMPEKDGLACIRELRRINSGARVIAVSGGLQKGGIDVLEMARRFGVRRTLTKPFAIGELIAEVESELRAEPAP